MISSSYKNTIVVPTLGKKKTHKKKATKKKRLSGKTASKGKTNNKGIKKSSKKVTTLKGYDRVSMQSIGYSIKIRNVDIPMSQRQCIQKVVIRKTTVGSDSAVITLADPNFKYINDNIYVENSSVNLKFWWTGDSSFKISFNGYISAIDINFASDGIPILTITCMDKTYLMHRVKQYVTYKDKTSADIVREIAKKYGFKCVVQSDYAFDKQESVSQSNQSDIEFITSLANGETYPFTATLVGNTLYYVKKGKLASSATNQLTYRDYPNDIISFSPQINTETIEKATGSTNTSNKSSNTARTSAAQNKKTDSSGSDKKPSTSKTSRTKGQNHKYNVATTRDWKTI